VVPTGHYDTVSKKNAGNSNISVRITFCRKRMSINRWIILGVCAFLFIEVLGFRVFPYASGSTFSAEYVAAAVSLVSLLCFLGLFFLIYVISAFQAAMNPYVNDVEDMGWLFNPMFLAWLFAKNKRKWCLYNTVIGAPTGFFFGEAVVSEGVLSSTTANELLLGTLVGVGFLAIAAICWYKGFCTPLTDAEDDDAMSTAPEDVSA
jgi:hypothetical protein